MILEIKDRILSRKAILDIDKEIIRNKYSQKIKKAISL